MIGPTVSGDAAGAGTDGGLARGVDTPGVRSQARSTRGYKLLTRCWTPPRPRFALAGAFLARPPNTRSPLRRLGPLAPLESGSVPLDRVLITPVHSCHQVCVG